MYWKKPSHSAPARPNTVFTAPTYCSNAGQGMRQLDCQQLQALKLSAQLSVQRLLVWPGKNLPKLAHAATRHAAQQPPTRLLQHPPCADACRK